ncbi:DUF6338 family protein [Halobium palmae]|uniref:DUF6338 family protein n=1 Tax=Halobium palmae TaxID=1776492 RepID=A0ABD5RVX9_9EURY
MAVSLPSLSLIYALLILTPGFLALKSYRKFGKITSEIERLDKAIYTIIISGISMSVVILAYSFYSGSTIESVINSSYGVLELSVGFLLMVFISIIMGILAGLYLDEWVNRDVDIRTEISWQVVVDALDEPTEVRAVMNNGHEIWGEIQVHDTDPHGQDIFLVYPQRIIRDEKGEIIYETDIGKSVFLSETEISHIYFEAEVDL